LIGVFDVTSNDVACIVRAQIGDQGGFRNAHGVDIASCLVPPVEIDAIECRAQDGQFRDEPVRVWLVLEERVVERDGYKIVFDEGSRLSGLAVAMKDSVPLFLGVYGSFIDALEAM
jgi:hypothetical protein